MSFTDQLHRYQQQCETALAQTCQTLPETNRSSVEHVLLNGGKRLRAAIVYALGEHLALPSSHCQALACAVEMVHAYSLVHDDLPCMDDDDMRRGKPTLHVLFNDAHATLIGDGLQSLAFEQLAIINHPRAIQCVAHLAKAIGLEGMVLGQMIDMSSEQKPLSLDELSRLHQRKTGDLLVACFQLPLALIDESKDNHPSHQKLLRFAQHIGLAFQVQDDILDATGNSDTLGKTAGKDQSQAKHTFVHLLGLDGAKQHAQHLVDQAKIAIDFLDSDHFFHHLADYVIRRTH